MAAAAAAVQVVGDLMPTMINNNGRVQSAIAFALAQVGKPYVWATAGPNSYDCSGLVYAAFKHAGYKFNGRPTTYTLIGMGTEVSKDHLQPGDLVFPDPGHVQIYLGGGMIVEAPHTGANVRRVKMWGFWRARRLMPNNLSTTAPPSATDPTQPSNPGGQNDSQLAALTSLARWIGDAHNWARVLMIILGVIMILIGVGRVAGQDVYDVVSAAT